MLVGVITIPYLISSLGVEAFGVLTLVWALIGYFSLFDFGLGRALTQQIATKQSLGLISDIPRVIKTGLVFTALTGLLGGGVLFGLAPKLSQSWLNVSADLQNDTLNSLLIAAFGIPFTTLTTGLRGVLEGFEDFKIVNILRIILGVANFGLPVLAILLFGQSLEYAVASLIIARLLVFMFHLVLVNKKIGDKWMRIRLSVGDFKGVAGFGFWMTVSNVISPLMVTADRFFISAVVGAVSVAYYTVPFEVLVRILIIPGALTVALFPKITALINIDAAAAKYLYLKSLRIVAVVLAPIVLITIACSHFGLSIWIGEDFADKSWLVMAILVFGIGFNGMAQVPYAAIQAAGNVRITALIHVFELIFYIPLLFASLKMFGINGAACAWVIRVLVDFLILQHFAGNIFKKPIYEHAA